MKAAVAPPASKITDDATFAVTATATTEPQPKVEDEPTSSPSVETLIIRPPPKFLNPSNPNPDLDLAQSQSSSQIIEPQPESNSTHVPETPPETPSPEAVAKPPQNQPQSVTSPYIIPPWSEPPCHPFHLEVLKDGSIIDQFNVSEKGAYMFGRVDLCDFVLEHPTISRFHAVLQFKRNGQAYLYDLGSTHGTFVNKKQVKVNVYVELHVGSIIRFGQSSRLYIFQGPGDLMPPEADLDRIRNAKVRQEMKDREASLLRAKRVACFAEGISWGMGEDAIEETEDDVDEVTWQTYKGQLTEKQEKTHDKVLKRYEKIAHMKKEIDAIRAKDIAQGGLTQGQQTQIARNEQRISQIVEELENLEETLNESIRESLGAHLGKISHGKKMATEDDGEFSSDDDEFYDRTKKKHSNKKAGESQSVETADSLLDKKEVIIKEIEDKKQLLLVEDTIESKAEVKEAEAGDALDAYMSGLSSQLVLDKAAKLQKEVSALQSELDRIVYLLKIADPAGEAAKKRDSRVHEVKSKHSEHRQKYRDSQTDEKLISRESIVQPKSKKSESSTAILKQPSVENERMSVPGKESNGSTQKQETSDATSGSGKKPATDVIVADATESKPAVYTAVKPQWLGAIGNADIKEQQQESPALNMQEGNQFVDYKDRKNILGDGDKAQVKVVDSAIENAAPGLIIRKRKQVEEAECSDDKAPENPASSSLRAQTMAEDAVALLLKHTRGLHTSNDHEGGHETDGIPSETQCRSDKKKPKRVLGPERPPFLDSSSDFESWVPPEGQSGDGRTSLNERYGY